MRGAADELRALLTRRELYVIGRTVFAQALDALRARANDIAANIANGAASTNSVAVGERDIVCTKMRTFLELTFSIL